MKKYQFNTKKEFVKILDISLNKNEEVYLRIMNENLFFIISVSKFNKLQYV